ncbi:metabotropic glutamate receptor 3-like [Dendronephthya gigantea]|uniref:metabotropic glutamate receptor 3-like n=1 Tax=Dendronephthya gigantea TaxID=151771 RepID=UPI00106C6D95|nr:metabotropic glutamate receptor 3-like [Dendronephthya gigantea]XP_028400122.1 metabotropic glutamate receptor 3-like [Dendronephthya gigantea]
MFCGSYQRWITWYYVFLVFSYTRLFCKGTGKEDDTAGIIDGDLVLGGLFRIRKINGTNGCDRDVEVQVGIQRVEAMLYAIHEINNNTNLLPNVTLGAEIRDTCSLKTKALDESLKFILDSLDSSSKQGEKCGLNTTKDVVGVVGPSRSSLSIEVAKLLRLFKVPQVSYASTSAELSNTKKYSFFARTVPPDSLQAQAMLHVVKIFNWSSVFTVNSAGSYGENGIEEFKKLASVETSVCVVLSKQVTDEYTSARYDEIINMFSQFSSTRVVVLFLKDNHLKLLLQAAKRNNYVGVVWIASDEWGRRMDIVENLGDYFVNTDAITLTLPSLELPKFKRYFWNLTGNSPRRENPWFQQYWLQCGNASCNTTFNDKLSYVIDAVYAFAYALHEMYAEKCPEMNGLCPLMRPVNGIELRNRILNVTFQRASSGHFVSFDENGDSKGKYTFFHYTKRDQYKKLGEWQEKHKEGQEALNLTNFPTRLRNKTSTCKETCKPWSRKVAKKGTVCCYECIDCPDKERQYVENKTKCMDCESFQKPTSNYDGCEDLPLRYISNRWSITITFFAGLGAFCTLIVIALLAYHINTPLVKASERDLVFLLLLGVLLNYITAIVFVSKLTVVTCAVQRFGFGLSATICYASLFVKIDRIGRRIFTTRSVKSVHFAKPQTQLVVVFLLIAVEMSLASAGLIIRPPEVIKVLPTKDDVFAKCNFGRLELMTSLPYIMILILLCTVYSVYIRKTISMFNEVKYIGLVMYSTCIISIAFLPVLLGTTQNYEPITMGLNTTLNATTILVCLFGPKVYILVFRPFRNVERSVSMTVNNYATDTQSKGQSMRVRKITSPDFSKPTPKDEKCEHVNTESTFVKNVVNENVSTSTDSENPEHVLKNEHLQSQHDITKTQT